MEDHECHSGKAKFVVIFIDNKHNTNSTTNMNDTSNCDQAEEMVLICYSQWSDFRQHIIEGADNWFG